MPHQVYDAIESVHFESLQILPKHQNVQPALFCNRKKNCFLPLANFPDFIKIPKPDFRLIFFLRVYTRSKRSTEAQNINEVWGSGSVCCPKPAFFSGQSNTYSLRSFAAHFDVLYELSVILASNTNSCINSLSPKKKLKFKNVHL